MKFNSGRAGLPSGGNVVSANQAIGRPGVCNFWGVALPSGGQVVGANQAIGRPRIGIPRGNWLAQCAQSGDWLSRRVVYE